MKSTRSTASAKARLKKSVQDLTTWLRFLREVRAQRPMTFLERAADLRTAKRYLARAERHAAALRRTSR